MIGLGFFKLTIQRTPCLGKRDIRQLSGLLQVMLDIIMDADNEIYEENLLIISDAYEVTT